MEAILHMLGLCPDSLSHLDLRDLFILSVSDGQYAVCWLKAKIQAYKTISLNIKMLSFFTK